MTVSHPSNLYIRKSPHKDFWVMCDADDSDEVKKVDFSTQYNSKGTTLPNDPVRGLRVLGTPSDSKNLWVDVLDPRGFVIRVRLEHFWDLYANSRSEGGEILDPCVWMLQGPYSVPMNLQSDVYIKHVKRQYLRDRRISLRDVARGNTVTLQDGDEVLYLGLFRLIGMNRDLSFRTKSFTFGPITKRYLYYNIKDDCLQASSSIDIAEIVHPDTMTPNDAHVFAHSLSYSQRSWEMANAVYMAPTKFSHDDLTVEIVEEAMTQDKLSKRSMAFFSRGPTYYHGTDWRNPRKPFDYVKSVGESTLFLNMTIPSLSPFRLALDDHGQFEIGTAPARTASFLRVSVQGTFPALLSGRLPR